jgi:RNA polymerase sigma-70 factor (ECF subfamily)
MSDDTERNDRLSRISTVWTMVFEAHRGSGEAVTAAQRQLLQRYGGAIHRYLLGALRDPHAAEELAQEFALSFIQGNFKRADPERGRFRDYVKTVLYHLIAKHQQGRRRAPVGLSPEMPEPADPITPYTEVADREFLARWREELLGRTWEALAKVEAQTGQLLHTALHFRSSHPEVASAQMAEEFSARLGRPFTAAGVRQIIHRAREKFADLLLEEVACSLETEDVDAVERELIDLELLTYCQDALERMKQKRGKGG